VIDRALNKIMDFLRSLNMDDLPEQQTRTRHLEEDYPDFDLKLGFDSCCGCGKSSPTVECDKCHRVMYCSDRCLRKDSQVSYDDDGGDGGDDHATGHSSVICALLALCNDDEIIDGGDDKDVATLSLDRQQSANERVASEYESYPATLANALTDIPLFQSTLDKCRRSDLTIHVVGASEESELWGDHPNKKQRRNVWQCYADALAEMAEKLNLKSIKLKFIGPDCPQEGVDKHLTIPAVHSKSSTASLHVTTFREDYCYSQSLVPDILVFFNPGFTCPDYNWKDTVEFMKDTIGIPFMVTTNTELEAIADLQWLWNQKLIQEIPMGLEGILQGNGSDEDHRNFNRDDDDDDDEKGGDSFLSVNPFSGMRVRQNGTMANDVYVKSRWIFGGLTGSSPSTKTEDPPPTKKYKSTSSKTSNPALK